MMILSKGDPTPRFMPGNCVVWTLPADDKDIQTLRMLYIQPSLVLTNNIYLLHFRYCFDFLGKGKMKFIVVFNVYTPECVV